MQPKKRKREFERRKKKRLELQPKKRKREFRAEEEEKARIEAELQAAEKLRADEEAAAVKMAEAARIAEEEKRRKPRLQEERDAGA